MATRILGPTGSRRRKRFLFVPLTLVALATFFPGTSTVPGPVTITARVAGSLAVGSIRIVVTP